MRIVAYYTESTGYEADAALLTESCRRLNIQPYVVGIRDRGDWYLNTAYKAQFIAGMHEHGRPTVYVDVDAFFHSDPCRYFGKLASGGYDFAAHWFQGPAKGHDRNKVREAGWWMLSGTLFFGDTERARVLLENWQALNSFWAARGHRDGGGQKNLWQCVTRMEHAGLKVARMPGRYCYVFDKPWAYPHAFQGNEDGCALCTKGRSHGIHGSVEPIVIEHTIASRENRGHHRANVLRQQRLEELRRKVAAA